MKNNESLWDECCRKVSIKYNLGGKLPEKEQTLVTGHAKKYFTEAALMMLEMKTKYEKQRS